MKTAFLFFIQMAESKLIGSLVSFDMRLRLNPALA